MLQLGGNLRWIAIVGLMIYVGSFAVGLGPIFLARAVRNLPVADQGYCHEHRHDRQLGANLIVAVSFPTLTKILGLPATFWLYGIITIGAWTFANFCVPETKGKTLEQIEDHWQGGNAARDLKAGAK